MKSKCGLLLSLFVIQSLVWIDRAVACSPGPPLACHIDTKFYQYKIDRVENPLPDSQLKVEANDNFDDKAMRRETFLNFENRSSKAIYFVHKASKDDRWAVRVQDANWIPFKMIAGTPAVCFPEVEDAKVFSVKELNLIKWHCSEEHDSCGYSDNHHPMRMDLQSEEYSQEGWLEADRKPAPTEPLSKTFHFLVDNKVEEVKVTWSIQLNEMFLHQACDQDEEFQSKPCSGKKSCWQAQRFLGLPKNEVKWASALNVSSPNYLVKVRLPIIDAKEEMPEFSRTPAQLRKLIGETLQKIEDEGKGTLSPELVMGQVANRFFADQVLVFDVMAEIRK